MDVRTESERIQLNDLEYLVKYGKTKVAQRSMQHILDFHDP